MMGPKKLNEVRRELKQAMRKSGDDPIRWLEERMKEPGARTGPSGEVLASLRRILGSPTRGRKGRAGRARKPVSKK